MRRIAEEYQVLADFGDKRWRPSILDIRRAVDYDALAELAEETITAAKARQPAMLGDGESLRGIPAAPDEPSASS